MKALVYKSTGSWYQLRNERGDLLNARIKGKLRIGDITSTNPVAVGDVVEVDMEGETGNAVITEIHERKNYINRSSPHRKNQHHIVAANIDQSLLFATLREPRTSLGFIDRFLITSEAYHIPAIIVFNKCDLYKEKDMNKLEEIRDIYEPIGYRIMTMSLETGEGLEEVKSILAQKVTLLSGHSGVGKSTFINHLFPGKELKTQDVSGWSGKGLHTTTFAEMYDLPGGGKIIDTPGIRELGLVDISKQELSHYMPEMRAFLAGCQFNNCIHRDEPGCAVKAAVNNGSIHEERYISYLNIMDSLDEPY
ncbi:MAG: ribosome small subunit-dependent GTPase A [Ferruginibacter sp.]